MGGLAFVVVNNCTTMLSNSVRVHSGLILDVDRNDSVSMLRMMITLNEIEAVIKKNLPADKSPGPEGFTGEFFQTF